jgi:hypothetical protein
MAREKYFLFHREPVTDFSSTESNTGDGLSVIAIPAERLGNITARKARVVFTFSDAGIYQTYGGSGNEGMPNVRIEVACEAGQEVELIEQILTFASKDTGRSIMKFDAVNQISSFPLAKVESLEDITPKVPKQAIILSTGAVSNDPAATDITQTTTTAIAGITFPAPSLMPIIDYNETTLPAHGQAVGAANNWNNSGSGGSTYHITNDTGTPAVNRDNGTSVNAVDFAAADNLIMANALELNGAYTIYMVIGTIGYGSFGHSILDNGATHIGFAAGAGEENTNSEFWVRHDTAVARRPAYMQLDNNEGGTVSYTYPDIALEAPDVNTVGFEGQTTYVFVLRRDKDFNLYLHNHTGSVVGYLDALIGPVDFATDGSLKIDDIGTGFRGFLPRIGVITDDIGSDSAAQLAKDLFVKYRKVY